MNSSQHNSLRCKGKIIIPAGRHPWPHEMRVAEILSNNGYKVEFLKETSIQTADIKLNGKEYEIKSPFTNKPDKIERNIKRGLKQSKNIIIDSYRIKEMKDADIKRFLTKKAKEQNQVKSMLFITKKGTIIDIK